MSDDDYPTLRIRGHGPTAEQIDELRLGAVDLRPLRVTSLQLFIDPSTVVTATLTFAVIPDIDVPGLWLVPADGKPRPIAPDVLGEAKW